MILILKVRAYEQAYLSGYVSETLSTLQNTLREANCNITNVQYAPITHFIGDYGLTGLEQNVTIIYDGSATFTTNTFVVEQKRVGGIIGGHYELNTRWI